MTTPSAPVSILTGCEPIPRHLILVSCYNSTPEQDALTRDCIAACLAQDVPGGVEILLIDNGSPLLATFEWASSLAQQIPNLTVRRNPTNIAPTKVANAELGSLFSLDFPHVLSVANDIILPPGFYRELLRWPRGLVTATQTQDMTLVRDFAGPVAAVSDHTPLACGLIRRWFYDALVAKDGYFLDDRYFHYCSDLDLSLRMTACGIRGVQLNIPYWHECSSSWRKATPEIAKQLTDGADLDRNSFIEKWGFAVTSDQYGFSCGDINFRG